ncbi:unnamed protein product [Cyprideis torosa]|uniref:Uncharacterized protein n=1 Tax=Cyprideis torosa TaxID=163714 RepID=A0A7R8ZFM2_9CRUS|nr:unnamed protein product [Cyprideis torosa]CAG0879457.1 unnamed protein product [Cyprideis torosa]
MPRQGIVPLSENMPSGKANKVGDVVYAMNGKSIQIMNTDAEGRLVLADGICYAETFKPRAIIDLATLTGAVSIALGPSAAAVFTSQGWLWEGLWRAGQRTGDRVWRMPLWEVFHAAVTGGHALLADVVNTGNERNRAGTCIAAGFLKHFVTIENWVHIDMSNVKNGYETTSPYFTVNGKTGRPTRTMIQFLLDTFACPVTAK